MKVSGLTIVLRGKELGYPFKEAILSALPICDEFVVVVGKGDDGTLEAVRSIGDSRIRIVETEWSTKVTPRKCLIAQQTNIGLHMCTGDWVLYLQANEILHELSLPTVQDLMEKHCDNADVEALLFERLTFWGDYGHCVGKYPERFKFTPRVVRPYIGTYSIRDGMSFAIFDGFSIKGRYPRALDTGEYVYRYGFVESAEVFARKTKGLVHEMRASAHLNNDFFYQALPRPFIYAFEGNHPGVMADRIARSNLSLLMDAPRWRTALSLRERRRVIETWFCEHCGVHWLGRKRHSLIGAYKKKAPVLRKT